MNEESPVISTVISYCTNELRFLEACIKGVAPFSREVFVPVCDHFFDGSPENLSLLAEHKANYPNINFLDFQWKNEGHPPRYWHNFARRLGARQASQGCEWVLFIDADEIVESDGFVEFAKCLNIDGSAHTPQGAPLPATSIPSYKLANYWYFREPFYRANVVEDSPIIVRAELASHIDLFSGREREQFETPMTPREVKVKGEPIVHHYSWVRTKEQMLKKVSSWGHSADKDWTSLVKEEFSREFNGTDFVHGYDYSTVENQFNL